MYKNVEITINIDVIICSRSEMASTCDFMCSHDGIVQGNTHNNLFKHRLYIISSFCRTLKIHRTYFLTFLFRCGL